MQKLTTREINKLADLVAEVTEQSDFDYQDEDYQKMMNDLQDKLNEMYLEEMKAR